MAPARSVGNTKSVTNGSRRSSMMQSTAPERLALSTSPRGSPPPAPPAAAAGVALAPALPRAGGEAEDSSSVSVPEPGENGRRVGPAGIREDDERIHQAAAVE